MDSTCNSFLRRGSNGQKTIFKQNRGFSRSRNDGLHNVHVTVRKGAGYNNVAPLFIAAPL